VIDPRFLSARAFAGSALMALAAPPLAAAVTVTMRPLPPILHPGQACGLGAVVVGAVPGSPVTWQIRSLDRPDYPVLGLLHSPPPGSPFQAILVVPPGSVPVRLELRAACAGVPSESRVVSVLGPPAPSLTRRDAVPDAAPDSAPGGAAPAVAGPSAKHRRTEEADAAPPQPPTGPTAALPKDIKGIIGTFAAKEVFPLNRAFYTSTARAVTRMVVTGPVQPGALGSRLGRRPRVRELVLQDLTGPNAEELVATLAAHPRLQALTLARLPWLDAGALARILAGQPHLARLTIEGCPLDGAALGMLPALTDLALAWLPPQTTRALDLALARMPSLTTLNVRVCSGLTGTTLPTGLTRMSIQRAEDFDLFKALERTPNLRSLVLEAGEHTAPLPPLPELEHLKLISIGWPGPSEAFLDLLADKPRLVSLDTSLQVEDRHLALLPATMTCLTLTDAKKITEAALGRFTRLRRLDVHSCGSLTGRGLPPGLTNLKVTHSPVLEPGCLPAHLECLAISHCKGINPRKLEKALPRLRALRELNLTGWRGNDPDPKLFARMPHLTYVQWKKNLSNKAHVGEWRRGPAAPAAPR